MKLTLTTALSWVYFASSLCAQPIEFNLLSRAVIKERLERIADKNSEREAALKQLFEQAGCNGGHLAEQPVKHTRLPNVVCTLEGDTDSVIVVGAHFDHVDVGKGAVDNWSGAALLPSLFEGIRARPRRHRYVFIGFTNEENGLVGSDHYVGRMTKQERARILAMVNLDCLGLSSTKVALTHSDKRLASLLAGLAERMELPISAVNTDRVGTSDQLSFARRKIPVLSVHSVTQETLPVLHSVRDQMSAIRPDDYYDSYRLMTVFLAALDYWQPPEKK